MGVLAHFIESAGIATTQISLVRLHTEKTEPPRAVWVSFGLGRPFGAPDDPALQHRVLSAALDLLGAETGPVLVDFPEDAPVADAADMEGWVCPMPVRPAATTADDPAATVLAEIASLRQWQDLFQERRGRTTVGVCPMSLEDIGRYLATMLADGEPGPTDGDLTPARILKLGSEDLKAFYSEAAIAIPGNKGSAEIADWFWGETEAGRTLLGLKPICIDSDDKKLQAVGKIVLVPRNQAHREQTAPSSA